jgi:hypothetical protein
VTAAAVGVQVDEAGQQPRAAQVVPAGPAARWRPETDLDDPTAGHLHPTGVEHAARAHHPATGQHRQNDLQLTPASP